MGESSLRCASESKSSNQEVFELMNQPFKLSIDLGKDGRQDGYLNVKTTSELSPFGCSMVPVTSIRNGDGPCVVVIGGCHGDEYEGQIIARSLLGAVEVEHVRGQLIVLPAANAKAVRAGRRFSPSDDGNLNAVFPGRKRHGDRAHRAFPRDGPAVARRTCRGHPYSWQRAIGPRQSHRRLVGEDQIRSADKDLAENFHW